MPGESAGSGAEESFSPHAGPMRSTAGAAGTRAGASRHEPRSVAETAISGRPNSL
jgi:hypothetical protein